MTTLSISEQSDLYDSLYQQGTDAFAKYNPCNFHKDSEGKVRCSAGEPCCGGCKYLGPDGCTTNSLACKLWICYTLDKQQPQLVVELKELHRQVKEAKLPLVFRGSKEDSFNDAVKHHNPTVND